MMMKLVFPAGDRPQMLLDQGAFRIGSAANADLVLASDGIEPLHCELQVGAQGVRMRVPEGIRVLVNERPVEGLIALRADDTVGLASTRFRLLDAAADAGRSASVARSDDAGETNATMVRPVVPKFALRGLSGELFGRSFPLSASLSVGRADDAGLRIPLESISHPHARLTPAGDEIRFDTQRFQLLVPGQAIHAQAQPARNGLRWQWLAAALVVVVAGAAWLLR